MPLAAGVWGVVATPFAGSTLEVDEASLARLVEHYERIGVTGLTVLGVFGEAAQLSVAERRKVLETVVDSVGLPLVVGVTALGTAPAIDEARLAVEVAGGRLAGVMIQANAADPAVLAAHLTAVYEATGAGIVVQDYPLASGVAVPTANLVAGIGDAAGVVAVKAEAPPTSLAVAMLAARLEVPVFGGLGGQGLLDELAAGAAGAMTGFSYPEGLIACVEAWRAGGYAAARDAFLPYLPLVNFEQQARIALAIRKECLRQRGFFTQPDARPPAAALPEVLRGQLGAQLAAVERAVYA